MVNEPMVERDELVEQLRESASLFREHPVYDSEGDGVMLTFNADLDDAAAARIQSDSAEIARLEAENARLTILLNTPEVEDWAKGAILEAAHQRERWGADHDAGKSPFDWFWLVGYLSQKAAASAVAGDIAKAKHHTISTGAALANWHLALTGTDNRMVPGAPLPIIDQADAA
jgi:hypothetical protein